MRRLAGTLGWMLILGACAAPVQKSWSHAAAVLVSPEAATPEDAAAAWLMAHQSGNFVRAKQFTARNLLQPLSRPATTLHPEGHAAYAKALDPLPMVDLEGLHSSGSGTVTVLLQLTQGLLRMGLAVHCTEYEDGWRVTRFTTRNAVGGQKTADILRLEQMVLEDPVNSLLWLQYGKAIDVEGHPGEVVVALQRAYLLSDPEDKGIQAELLGQLGLAYHEADAPVEAEICLGKSLELEPTEKLHYLRLGSFYSHRGRAPEAIELYEFAMSKIGEHPEFFENMAYAYQGMEDLPKAIQSLERAVALRRELPSSQENQRWLEYDLRAIQELKKKDG